ncbi:inositol monophosphatase family protein [Nonomuraea sp. ZG12]|uniref:inositol monophosphatase family protein n=1 Tax=Nonomuraea sp. ZG12 TaxID=3452207 RepID=UPI003F8CE4B3
MRALGEEGGQQGAANAARQWLVDPLCGMLNYAVGSMLVAVNVALRNGGSCGGRSVRRQALPHRR